MERNGTSVPIIDAPRLFLHYRAPDGLTVFVDCKSPIDLRPVLPSCRPPPSDLHEGFRADGQGIQGLWFVNHVHSCFRAALPLSRPGKIIRGSMRCGKQRMDAFRRDGKPPKRMCALEKRIPAVYRDDIVQPKRQL